MAVERVGFEAPGNAGGTSEVLGSVVCAENGGGAPATGEVALLALAFTGLLSPIRDALWIVIVCVFVTLSLSPNPGGVTHDVSPVTVLP